MVDMNCKHCGVEILQFVEGWRHKGDPLEEGRYEIYWFCRGTYAEPEMSPNPAKTTAVDDARLDQLANDPMMCNITEETRSVLREAIASRAQLSEQRTTIERLELQIEAASVAFLDISEGVGFPIPDGQQKISLPLLVNRVVGRVEEFRVQVAQLEAQLTAMTEDRDLWQNAHDDDCPNKAMLETVEAQLRQEREAIEAIRFKLWAGHGHTGIYGDDGEMQCIKCLPWDYKRAPIQDVVGAAILSLHGQVAQLQTTISQAREFLEAIVIAFKEPDGGPHFKLRAFAEKQGIYADDLGRDRVMLRIAQAALAHITQKPEEEAKP